MTERSDAPLSEAALMRAALEKIEDFANGYGDVGDVCYKIARDALRAVDALPQSAATPNRSALNPAAAWPFPKDRRP